MEQDKILKMVYTKDYALAIDEEAECPKDTWAIFPNTINGEIKDFDECTPVKCKWDYAANGNSNLRIIAYYPLAKEAKELDLPLLPNPYKVKYKNPYYEICDELMNPLDALDSNFKEVISSIEQMKNNT